MPDILLPAALPWRPLAAIVEIEPVGERREFRPDIGRPKARPATTARERNLAWQVHATWAQAEAWLRFYEDDCAAGSLVFIADHPLKIEPGLLRWFFTAAPKLSTYAGGHGRVALAFRRVV